MLNKIRGSILCFLHFQASFLHPSKHWLGSDICQWFCCCSSGFPLLTQPYPGTAQPYVTRIVLTNTYTVLLSRVSVPVGRQGVVGWLNIFKSCGSSDYFNSWRFGGIVDEIFIKTKCQSCKSTVRIANEILSKN